MVVKEAPSVAGTAELVLPDWHPLPFNLLVGDRERAGKELKLQPRSGSQGHMYCSVRGVLGTITPHRPKLRLGVTKSWCQLSETLMKTPQLLS